MDGHIEDLIPFYANQTLDDERRAAVEAHLATCPHCRERLAEWKAVGPAISQAAGVRLRRAAEQGVSAQAPLSPLVYASLKRRPSLSQAILSAANLIWAQRIFVMQGWFLPTLSAVLVLGVLVVLGWRGLGPEWAVFPLLALVPMAAALSVAFLYIFDNDPAVEIVAAAPTPPGTLVFARLTLALGTISLLAMICSLALAVLGSGMDEVRLSIFNLIAAWLGPMLLLSALTTVLALSLQPRAAAGTALVIWGGVITSLVSEWAGSPLVKLSLLPLLHPGWALLAGEMLLAGLLWLGCWLWLANGKPDTLRLEGGG
jgi:hypothetical protein